MSKKTNFNDEMLVDQPDIGCYYPTNMFRFPEEDMMRPMPPPMKNTNMKPYSQGSQSMAPAPSVSKPTVPAAGDEEAMLSPTLTNIGFTQAYLRTLIGKRVRISFLIGTSLLVDRVGVLTDVGISYIVLKQLCCMHFVHYNDIRRIDFGELQNLKGDN